MKQYNYFKVLNISFLLVILGVFSSPSLFAAGKITIHRPGADEKIDIGQNYSLSWSSDDIEVPYLKISLLDSSGKMVEKISGGAPNQGHFVWSVPENLAAGKYRLEIYTSDSATVGLSDIFTLEPAQKRSKVNEKRPEHNLNPGPDSPPGTDPLPSQKPNIQNSPKTVHKGQIVTPVVTFLDTNLEQAVRELINKPSPVTIFSSFLRKFTVLNLRGREIKNLSGLEYFHALRELDLGENSLTDISRLALLDSLQKVSLDHNQIENIEPLLKNEHLGAGVKIDLTDNPVDCKSQTEIIAGLRKRGVALTLDCK